MNFDLSGDQDYSGLFRICNLVVSVLTVLSGISQLFSGFQAFILGLYLIAFGGVIGLLEFRVPPEAYAYGSFLFSFIGRGIFYTLISSCIKGASIFRFLSSVIIFIAGLVYIALEAVPSISPPENMNPEGLSIGVNDEDVI